MVLFPTPPLPAPTAMTHAGKRTVAFLSLLVRSSHVRSEFDFDGVDLMSGLLRGILHRLFDVVPNAVLHWARRRRELDGDEHLRAFDIMSFDHSEGHQVLPEIGVTDGSESFENAF